jgi:hypothetical protein
MPLSELDDALTISVFGLMFNSQSCSCFSYGYKYIIVWFPVVMDSLGD